jgi:hypothetical protein
MEMANRSVIVVSLLSLKSSFSAWDFFISLLSYIKINLIQYKLLSSIIIILVSYKVHNLYNLGFE